MSKKEIKGGIKRALERGQSLQDAKKSFTNAGYNPDEVEAASRELRGIVERVSQPSESHSKDDEFKVPNPPSSDESFNEQKKTSKQKKVESKSKTLVIILTMFLLFLIIILIVSLFFKDRILEFINNTLFFLPM